MDELMDILIPIAVVAIFILNSYIKIKKKQAQVAQQQQKARRRPSPPPVPPSFEENEKPVWQDIFESSQTEPVSDPQVSATSYEEIPKNPSYFSYETIEPEIKEEPQNRETSFHEAVEKNVQNIDNKEEKMSPISLDMEDIYKGVIYSEILKRPYN